MHAFLDWSLRYSKMFGVVAAVMIFGAWLVQNIIVEQLKSLKDVLARAEDERREIERQFRMQGKLLEIYQVAASARQYANEARQQSETHMTRLFNAVERLERVGVTRDFAYAMTEYIARSNEFLSVIEPPSPIRATVISATTELASLRNALDQRKAVYETEQKQIIIDNVINPNKITEAQIDALIPVINKYRDDVEFGMASTMPTCINDVFWAYDRLFEYSRTKLARRRRNAKMARFIQILPYVVGSILALYGSYLQASAPEIPIMAPASAAPPPPHPHP